MTNEEKQLLLKDLCARLPYGVKGLHRGQVHELFTIDSREVNNTCIQVDGYDAWFSVDTFKPYLRPMKSMTEKEEEEYWNVINLKSPEMPVGEIPSIETISQCSTIVLDWLLSKGFDIRGLLPMGLALEAKEGMYKTE